MRKKMVSGTFLLFTILTFSASSVSEEAVPALDDVARDEKTVPLTDDNSAPATASIVEENGDYEALVQAEEEDEEELELGKSCRKKCKGLKPPHNNKAKCRKLCRKKKRCIRKAGCKHKAGHAKITCENACHHLHAKHQLLEEEEDVDDEHVGRGGKGEEDEEEDEGKGRHEEDEDEEDDGSLLQEEDEEEDEDEDEGLLQEDEEEEEEDQDEDEAKPCSSKCSGLKPPHNNKHKCMRNCKKKNKCIKHHKCGRKSGHAKVKCENACGHTGALQEEDEEDEEEDDEHTGRGGKGGKGAEDDEEDDDEEDEGLLQEEDEEDEDDEHMIGFGELFDSDRDRYVTLDEVKAVLSKQYTDSKDDGERMNLLERNDGDLLEALTNAFTAADKNKDGKLSAREIDKSELSEFEVEGDSLGSDENEEEEEEEDAASQHVEIGADGEVEEGDADKEEKRVEAGIKELTSELGDRA